jgi:hypothetical protein
MALSHYHVISRPSGKLAGSTRVIGTYGSKHGRPGWGAQQSAGRIARIYAERLGDTRPSRIAPGYFMVGSATKSIVIQVRACYDHDICQESTEGQS